jgi:hypothetical protein
MAQLMLYFMAINMVTTVYQFYTIIIFYYNVRSAAHEMQTSNGTENQYKWLQSWQWVDKCLHVQFNLCVSVFQSCCSFLPTYTLCDVIVIFAVPGPRCGVKEVVSPMLHSSYLRLCHILCWVWLLDSSIVMFECHLWNSALSMCLGRQGTAWNVDINCKKKDSLLPRSAVFDHYLLVAL